MRFFRKYNFVRIFAFLCALQVLNLSVDAPDLHPYGCPDSDLSFNEMNSLSEIIFEKILKIENAFPEYPERSNRHESSAPATAAALFFSQQTFDIIPKVFGCQEISLCIHRNLFILPQHFGDVMTPPPKAVSA